MFFRDEDGKEDEAGQDQVQGELPRKKIMFEIVIGSVIWLGPREIDWNRVRGDLPEKKIEARCCAPNNNQIEETLIQMHKEQYNPQQIAHNPRERTQIRFNEVRLCCLRPRGKKERVSIDF